MIAILEFLGTNCQRDMKKAFDFVQANKTCKISSVIVGHREKALPKETSLVVIPGGFSYGDYWRSGCIASQMPIMKAIKAYASNGGRVLGICNGFQILTESKLLEGALIKNRDLKFIAKNQELYVENNHNALLKDYQIKEKIILPIAHKEGNFYAPRETLERLYENKQVLLCYSDDVNGSVNNIAGICNKDKNVFALMPHPERALGIAKTLQTPSIDGVKMLLSLLEAY
ncbi:phosphoribosylformylglycinamidine synthase subunit PurQ [Helicobacter cetorum]|uniref:phosphoribosylformylglycinamidine synthase subunit PurQ n=1 Tax=Helicobacter cetorum TaxID=138563 RepID=UPI000CF1B028|nr:phosphoribosylformylglycinamidine synthase subunit PurQ [Helicobacter cetorum]